MLIDDIRKANIQAMKDHDQAKRSAYAMVITRYQTLLTSKEGANPGDPDVIRIIQKFVKELDEEKQGYLQAGRAESAAEIDAQLSAVEVFLPKMMSEDEIRAVIASLEDKSIPSVMKHFKANYDGQADMGLVSKIARNG